MVPPSCIGDDASDFRPERRPDPFEQAEVNSEWSHFFNRIHDPGLMERFVYIALPVLEEQVELTGQPALG